MITIEIYGLDQYIVGELSREMTPNLAKLYEVEEDDINFIAPNCMLFHNGIDQTSWNILVKVFAPMKVSVLQDQVATLIQESIGEVAINKNIEFYYYSQDNRYSYINDDYPLYITKNNIVEEYHEDDDEDYDEHEELEEGEGEGQIYTGNIFKDFNPGN